MTIFETFSEGPKPYNEDRIIITPDFVGITDGSSSSHTVRGEPGGLVVAEAIAEAMGGMPPAITFQRCIATLTCVVREVLREGDGLIPAAATLTLYSRARRELWRLGSGHVVVDGTGTTVKPPHMSLICGWRSAILRERLLNGATVSSLRKLTLHEQPFKEWLEIEPRMLNHPSEPYGVGALNGMPIPTRYLRVESVEPGVQRICIASDGFLSAPPTLEAGLHELDACRKADPLMIHIVEGDRAFPVGQRFFDDTSFVAFQP